MADMSPDRIPPEPSAARSGLAAYERGRLLGDSRRVRVGLYLPERLYALVREHARRNGRNVSQLVSVLLADELTRD